MRLLLFLFFAAMPIFALIPAEVYPALHGIWTSNSEGEMDIFMTFGDDGSFKLSVVPAFEFQGLSAKEQTAIIEDCVSGEGRFKVLNAQNSVKGVSAQTEILLNGETTTNTLLITEKQIFISEGGKESLFMTKESFE